MVRFARIYEEYVSDNARRNKKTVLAFAVTVGIGFVLGIVFAAQGLYIQAFFADSMVRALNIFTGQTGFFGIIFRGVLINAQFFVLVFLFSLSPFLKPLNFLFFCYKGYVYGAALVVFTGTLGVGGFATALILVIPQQLVLMAALCLYICYIRPLVRAGRRCGRILFWDLLRVLFIFFLLSLISIVLEIAVVYVIIKPFHIII